MIRFMVGVAGGLMLVAGVASLGGRVTAQASLPLANLGIEHLDIVVPRSCRIRPLLRAHLPDDAAPAAGS